MVANLSQVIKRGGNKWFVREREREREKREGMNLGCV